MGVDTKGYILTSEKDFWKVSQRIGNALYKLIRPNYKAVTFKEKAIGNDQWKLPKVRIALESYFSLENDPTEYFQFLFTYNGEERILHCHTDCDCDLTEEFGEGAKGIILSFGMWGSSEEIMRGVLEQLKDMGDCYIKVNDSEGDVEKV